MLTLEQWAIKHGVSYAALQELRASWGLHGTAEEPTPTHGAARSDEAAVQGRVRLEAAQLGLRLWRNNVGALTDERGVPVRYGLANDTKALNKAIKSGDLIGLRPVVITPAHVGRTLGQFVSRECKPAGWTWSGNERELAQLKWAQMINACGGNAAFVTGTGSFK